MDSGLGPCYLCGRGCGRGGSLQGGSSSRRPHEGSEKYTYSVSQNLDTPIQLWAKVSPSHGSDVYRRGNVPKPIRDILVYKVYISKEVYTIVCSNSRTLKWNILLNAGFNHNSLRLIV